MYRFIVLIFFLAGCSPNSLEDFQHEGEAVCKTLVKDLQKVQTHDDLVHMLPKLKKNFDHLADVIIQAKQYQKKHPDEEAVMYFTSDHDELLLEEFQRIYLIEGARALMEKAEREALLRLDAQERLMQKQKDMIMHPKK